ncbi:MAG: hypothetical protein ACYDHH_10315 [Solirubrobacteraceae bacterium]
MRVTTTRVGTAILSAAAVARAPAIAACGSSTVSAVSGVIDPVAKAAAVSNGAGGYKMDFTMSIQTPQLPSGLTANGTGTFDTTNRTGSVSIAINFGNVPGISAVLGSSTLQLQELLNGSTFYIKLPSAISSRLPGAKPWLKVDLNQIGSHAGIPGLGSLMSNPTSSNPAAMLQYMKAVSGKITKVGTATVNGYQTTEYRANIDFSKYPSLVPASQRSQAQQTIAAIERLTQLKMFPVVVWIDSNHLVRRMQFQINEQLASAGAVKTALTLNITGYGPQPSPSFPPASQVGSASSLLGAGG